MPRETNDADRERVPSLFIASIHREEGGGGVQTHIRQFRQYLDTLEINAPVVTSFS